MKLKWLNISTESSQNYLTIAVVFLLLFSGVNPADASSSEAVMIELYETAGWKLVKTKTDGLKVYEKKLKGLHPKALMVSQIINIHPQSIYPVVEDVASYNRVLSSIKFFNANLLIQSAQYIDGHQYYQLPLFKDRHLIFRMQRTTYDNKKLEYRTDWVILKRNGEYIKYIEEMDLKNDNPHYMDIGAGSWLYKQLGDGKWEVSYRLFIDPGEGIPDFILESSNRRNIVNLFYDVIKESEKTEKQRRRQ